MEQMKVLQIGLGFNPGGMESFIMTYYRELQKCGVQFDFIAMFPHIAYAGRYTIPLMPGNTPWHFIEKCEIF